MPVSFDELRASCTVLPEANKTAAEMARARQAILTKPSGSLGRLEELAIWLAAWQGREIPELDKVQIIVFAGSHGVAARGVSAFPSEVTGQMVANFNSGGAAINQLAKQAGAFLDVIPLDTETPTQDFTERAAMEETEFLSCVKTGYEAVAPDGDLLCLGEMGIGNTTSAAAICAHLFGSSARHWVGRGTGVDESGLSRKIDAVEAALKLHVGLQGDPLRILAAVGGRELAAIFGATLAARHYRIPVLLDGFACTTAAAALFQINSAGLHHAASSHCSAEQAHRALLERLAMRPILDLEMRLGEASGACLAVNILRAAVACHSGMASFAEAGVASS